MAIVLDLKVRSNLAVWNNLKLRKRSTNILEGTRIEFKGFRVYTHYTLNSR